MNKYIVKNCPTTYQNFEDKFVCTSRIKQKGFPFYCQDCTDCLIKQIVEKCKSISAECFDQWCFANYILESLEIEEVNE